MVPSRPSALRRTLFSLFGLAFVGLLLFSLAPHFLAYAAASWAYSATGRVLAIDAVSIEWGRETRVELRGVRLANASWSETRWMLAVDRMRLRVTLAQLLHGRRVFDTVAVDGAALLLETQDGDANWQFAARPVPFLAWGGGEPRVEFLEVRDLAIRYHDPRRDSDIVGGVAGAFGSLTPSRSLITGQGDLDQQSFTFRLRRDGAVVNIALELGETMLLAGAAAGDAGGDTPHAPLPAF